MSSKLSDYVTHQIGGGWGDEAPKDGLKKVAVIRGTDIPRIKNGDISTVPYRYEKQSKLPQRFLHPGDLILEVSGGSSASGQHTGRALHITKEIISRLGGFVIPASFCKLVRLDAEKVRPEYCAYFIDLMHLTKEISVFENQSTGISNFQTSKFLEATELPLDYSSQKTVSEFFLKLDGLRLQLLKQNITLEAIAQRLFRSWFVNFDPVHAKAAGREPEAMSAETAALFPSEFEESVLGLIPKGWSATPYSENIVIHSGGTPKTSSPDYWNGDIPWFSVTDAPAPGQVFVLKTEKHITKAGLENSPARLLPHRSTIISARGTVGKIGMVGGVMTINQSCYALSPSSNHGNYWVYFQTKELVSKLKQMAHGGVFDTITRDTFKGVKVAIPSEQIFESFSRVCQPLFDAIECNGNLSLRLTELRDHLLPRLISGKLSLADAKSALATVKPEVGQV